ncbi:MAG: TetR/AcrR family transcriptional regulator [Acidimicrobiia bacterium]|nr:TetR/AcrR family transcriptional regulator [Acidimicrobiia bacterium]MDH5235994.1 TetR/AcrR family transcriptional regulator [Acidimicrobiia bacterium]
MNAPVAGNDIGRRQRRKQQTRRDIMAAADALFAEVGYDDTRTAEIARQAGISEPTVFRYFPTKADIAMVAFNEWVDDLVDWFIELIEDRSPYQAVVEMIGAADSEAFQHTQVRTALGRALERPELVSQVFWALDNAVGRLAPALAARRSVSQDDVSAVLDAKLVVAILEVSIRQWLAGHGTNGPLDLVRECADRLEVLLDAGT